MWDLLSYRLKHYVAISWIYILWNSQNSFSTFSFFFWLADRFQYSTPEWAWRSPPHQICLLPFRRLLLRLVVVFGFLWNQVRLSVKTWARNLPNFSVGEKPFLFYSLVFLVKKQNANRDPKSFSPLGFLIVSSECRIDPSCLAHQLPRLVSSSMRNIKF